MPCFYHPDDPAEHRLEQEAQMRALYDATQASGHELLLEIIPPGSHAGRHGLPIPAIHDQNQTGWWKLESMTAAQWRSLMS
jgi:5-dehydro-2-deoxygluconokinase